MNIAQHRKAKGLSQIELARLLGYSQRVTIGNIENNPHNTKLGVLIAYAQACDVSLPVLLGIDADARIMALIKELGQ